MDRIAGTMLVEDVPKASGGGGRVLVLGGGCAGIAAALRLAEAGWRVMLIERRKMLGGRAGSHVDPQTGQLLDNCQHVLLGCCTHLIDLYQRLGVSHLIEWHETLHFLDRTGRHDRLRRGRLPAPLHLGPAIARMRMLSWRDKWTLARAGFALLRSSRAEQMRWEERTFADWLAAQRQPPEVIERFWDVIVTSALNQTVREANAAYAMQVFRQGFLEHRDAYVMGLATVPLARLYEPAQRMLEAAGGQVLTGRPVRRLLYDGRRLTGVELADGERMEADAYVSALPPEQLLRVAPAELCQEDDRLSRLHALHYSPIAGIHLWFDAPVMALPHAVLIDSPLQWVFNRGTDERQRQHLHVVISAADEWMEQRTERIIAQVLDELAVYLSSVRRHRPAAVKVIKERRATFAPLPGVEKLRPDAAGSTGNLLLAGDFCRTGWPATMEGAVRSGNDAAAALLKKRTPVVPDLPGTWLSRRR